MLTYQLQQRVYKIKNNKEPIFPNNVEIEIFLEPTEQFGVISDPEKLIRTTLVGHETTTIFDANTGRVGVLPVSALKPIEAIFEQNGLSFKMQGNKIIAKIRCEDFESLNGLLIDLHYKFPIILNLEFAEPPVVKYTCGKIGDSVFSWELEKGFQFIDATTKANQESRVIDSFNRLEVIRGLTNRRLAAAFYHFYVARRLVESGNSPYEFLSESVLNLCKILQVLFGEERDDVRRELKKIDYSNEEIEETFIPIMFLRNEFDIGHVFLKMFTREHLKAMYSYLEYIERDFRNMLKNVLEKVLNGEYALKQDPNLSLNKDELKIMKKLIDFWESYVSKRKPLRMRQ